MSQLVDCSSCSCFLSRCNESLPYTVVWFTDLKRGICLCSLRQYEDSATIESLIVKSDLEGTSSYETTVLDGQEILGTTLALARSCSQNSEQSYVTTIFYQNT